MLLIDENLSYKLVPLLQVDFPGICAVGRVLSEGTPDKEVWEYARTHELAILTKDKDFVEYWRRYGPPPKVVRIEIGNCRVSALVARVCANRERIHRFVKIEHGGLLII